MRAGSVCRRRPSGDSISVSLFDIFSLENAFEIMIPSNVSAFTINSNVSKMFVSRDSTVLVYCLFAKELLKVININNEVESLVANSSGTKLMASHRCEDEAVNNVISSSWTLWDVEADSFMFTITCTVAPKFSFNDLFVVALNKNILEVWDCASATLVRTTTCTEQIQYFSPHSFASDIVFFHSADFKSSDWVVWNIDSNLFLKSALHASFSFISWIEFGSPENDVCYCRMSVDSTRERCLVAMCMSSGETIYRIYPPMSDWKCDFYLSDDTLIFSDSLYGNCVAFYSASSGELLWELREDGCYLDGLMQSSMCCLK